MSGGGVRLGTAEDLINSIEKILNGQRSTENSLRMRTDAQRNDEREFVSRHPPRTGQFHPVTGIPFQANVQFKIMGKVESG